MRRSGPSQRPGRTPATGGSPGSAAPTWRAAKVSLSGFHLWTESGGASAGRLIAFAFNTEQTYLLALTGRNLAVYSGDARIADLPTPWTGDEVSQVVWAQSADTLLMTHPDAPPVRVTRALLGSGPSAVEDWRVGPWRFLEEDSRDEDDEPTGTALRQPYHKFADPEITLAPSGTDRDAGITLTASEAVFGRSHVGQRLRLGGRQIEVTAVQSPTRASATVKQTLLSRDATKDWEEPAFSARRGWPATVAFHQDRLVIGGARDLPNRIWLSKSGDLFNFDLGEGLDDDGIEFAILSDQVNAIRAVFSGRHLQVLTSGAEWMVTGDPLTPGNIQLKRQTRIGSPVDRFVPPRDVDGATLFAARNGRELREFLFADVEQAYQSNDLALLARHLIDTPVDQDYDPLGRLFHIVMADGSLATVTVYRAEKVTGWSRQETDGRFLAIAVVDRTVYTVVDRAGGRFIERFDATLSTDSALTGSDAGGKSLWSGLGHLEGRTLAAVADDAVHPPVAVAGGAIALSGPATAIEAGLPFASRIRALPPVVQTVRGASHGSPVRLVEAVFRLLGTRMLRIDTGAGPRTVPFRTLGRTGLLDAAPPAFTGDVAIRALGWLKGAAPPWSLEQSDPPALHHPRRFDRTEGRRLNRGRAAVRRPSETQRSKGTAMASLTAISTALSAAGTLASAAISASQADRAAQMQIEAQNREHAMRAQQMKLRHEIEERRRKRDLKEALAARRARFGGAGIGAAGGSAAALLAGLRRKSAKAGAEAAKEKRLGLQSNLLSVENSNRRALQNAAFANESAAFKGSFGLAGNIVDGLKEIRRGQK